MAELSRQLGMRGIWVDQVTTLDPHPVDGVREPYVPTQPDWGDAAMTPWENVIYWDNYWRTDGDHSLDFTGETVPNTFDRQLVEQRLEQGGYVWPFGGEHSDVHLWYYGTIDTSTDPPANNGDHDVPNNWYGGSHPGRIDSGYFFARVIGGARPSEGLSSLIGGGAVREDIDWSLATWPNILDFRVDNDQSVVQVGDLFRVLYYYQDVDSNATTTFYLDEDRNPYNGNGHQTDQRFEQRTGETLFTDGQFMHTDAISPGTYYVSARISDSGGRSRWVHAAQAVTVIANPSPEIVSLSVSPPIVDEGQTTTLYCVLTASMHESPGRDGVGSLVVGTNFL